MFKPKPLKAHRTDGRRVMKLADVLALLDAGTYTVNLETGEVIGPRGPVTPHPFKRRGNGGHVDYYVRLYTTTAAGVKLVKSIALHRLVWMTATRSPIPDGFEIHHRDENPRNNAFRNLLCLHTLDHRKMHENEAAADEPIPF